MSDRSDAIRRHIADMKGVEQHILNAIERQREEDVVRQNPEANKIIIQIERVLREHLDVLDKHAERFGGTPQSGIKEALSGVLGVVAGMYDKIRDHELSRILRDNYTALSLAAMSYTMLHTFSLAVKEEELGSVALSHLKDLTPILVEISQVLPRVLVPEIASEHEFPVDASVGDLAVTNTQEAWNSSVTERS
jgi:hypothetical protein